jgi:membrane protein DedA with SNARE-associated domain
MAHLQVVNVHAMFVVCLVAVLGGDVIAFSLGRCFGSRLMQSRFFRRLLSSRKQIRVRAYFRKYGSKVIFVGRFLPGLRFSIFLSAGTLRLRPAVFLIYDALAALISVPTLVYLAWFWGEHIDRVLMWVRRSEYGILVGALALSGFVAFKIYRQRQQAKHGNPGSVPIPCDGPRRAQ